MLLFHGTARNFEAFDASFMIDDGKRHPNCELGLWLSTSPHLASRFGTWTLAVEAPADNPYLMPIRDLSRLASLGARDDDGGIRRHQEASAHLRSLGHDIILVVEEDGSNPTVVALAPENVRIVQRVPSDASGLAEMVRLDEEARAAEGREMSPIEQQLAMGLR